MLATEAPPPVADTESVEFLVDVVERLSLARTAEEVAEVVRVAARRISGADGVAIVVRDEDRCWYLDEDAVGPLWKGQKFPMSACISGWAMLNRDTAVIPDIYADERVPHAAYRSTFVKSLIMTPVREDDPIGAIGAYWATKRTPTQDEVRRLQLVARAAAAALENARLYANLTETLERRQALVDELDHRARNTLAMARSLAQQTLRYTPAPAAFKAGFTSRVDILARAHDLLTRNDWRSAMLDDVVASALEPTMAARPGRLSFGGRGIRLDVEAALALHLVLGELASNALTHGALSDANGVVEVRWGVSEARGQPTLEFTWTERGGPTVREPWEPRFGLRLIERGVPTGQGSGTHLAFDPEGVRFRWFAPLSPRVRLADAGLE